MSQKKPTRKEVKEIRQHLEENADVIAKEFEKLLRKTLKKKDSNEPEK